MLKHKNSDFNESSCECKTKLDLIFTIFNFFVFLKIHRLIALIKSEKIVYILVKYRWIVNSPFSNLVIEALQAVVLNS